MRIPGEVAFPISVLDIKPNKVVGDVVLIEACVHRAHVFLVIVVPTALVVPEGRQRREGLGA